MHKKQLFKPCENKNYLWCDYLKYHILLKKNRIDLNFTMNLKRIFVPRNSICQSLDGNLLRSEDFGHVQHKQIKMNIFDVQRTWIVGTYCIDYDFWINVYSFLFVCLFTLVNTHEHQFDCTKSLCIVC